MTATPGQQLQIHRLDKRYGDTIALQDMTFEVQPGELFGFVGSNGAGKTTTMRIALGVLAADSGHVHLGGRPIDLAVRRRIGYMPEERGLYPKMRVGHQLSYLAQLHGLSSGAAADAVTTWTTRLGIDSRVNDTVDALSLGNQQRVQLAAALVHDPDVLVLDEPFSGLDPVAVDVMSDVLAEKAADGVPVIFSSHQLDLVERLCHRVGIVVGGHMQECGPVDELRAAGGTQLIV
ncbi:MAG: ATP-binding cassette domain-containing protein, partial [Mycobacteriaceae bacterium]